MDPGRAAPTLKKRIDYRPKDGLGTEPFGDFGGGVSAPALLITANPKTGKNELARESGVQGVVRKRGSRDDLLAAPPRVTGGDAPCQMCRTPPRRAVRGGAKTARRQVLELVATGLTDPEISEQLGVGVETVKTLLERSFRKLGVSGTHRSNRRSLYGCGCCERARPGWNPRAALLFTLLEDAPNRLKRIVEGHITEREAHNLAGRGGDGRGSLVGSRASRPVSPETALNRGRRQAAVARTLNLFPAELDAAGAQRPGTVLCIEDDPTSRPLVERIVARRPRMALVTAASGEEGLALAFENPPDFVLLDLRLPDLSGDEVLRRLKQRARNGRLPA